MRIDVKNRIVYYADGKGVWFKRTWPRQCQHKVFMGGRCQGCEGHGGEHWCYDGRGSFVWEDHDAERDCFSAAGTTPPDGKGYRHPADMWKYGWWNYSHGERVTDPKELRRLESGQLRSGEAVVRPLEELEAETVAEKADARKKKRERK